MACATRVVLGTTVDEDAVMETRRMTVVVVAWLAGVGAGLACSTRSVGPAGTARPGGNCSARTPEPCEPACFQGSADACYIYGAAVEGYADAPVRLPQDLPRGRKALEHGCNLGGLEACRVLASYRLDDGEAKAACDQWESLCDRGDRRSCSFFATCLLYTKGYRRDPQRALRLLEDGCAHDERVSCSALGQALRVGEVIAKDERRAYSLFDRACRLDDQLACARAGEMLETGEGCARDVERAKTLYRTSCARGIRSIPCEALGRLGEEPPATEIVSAAAAESVHRSTRYHFELRIAANWEFVSPAVFGARDEIAGMEIVAARRRDAADPATLVYIVAGAAQAIPGKRLTRDAQDLDLLEDSASKWMEDSGIEKIGASRMSMFGSPAARIDGRERGPAGLYVSIVAFWHDNRRFEARCTTRTPQANLPCRDAYGALVVRDLPAEEIRDTDRPHPLHLRNTELGISYDAPDDTWLAIGPRVSMGGTQSIWVWNKAGRRIEISAFDLRTAPRRMPQEPMATFMAGQYRKAGSIVAVDRSELAGRPCEHLQIDPPAGDRQDIFLQERDGVVYGLLVTVETRDKDLLARARAGLRITGPPAGR
jgi:hypothetical protein